MAEQVVIVQGKLRKIIHQAGNGQYPTKGQLVHALYRGTLETGQQFDSNQNRDEPFSFTLGQGQVIKGWDEGFASMTKGEKATLICSPEYGYGAQGSPPRIPPNSTLHFEVQLINFTDKKKQKWELSEQQKLTEATKMKQSGNDHLKKGQYRQAIDCYKQGIQYADSELGDSLKNIKKLLELNISQAYLKNKDYFKCIQNCTKVLSEEPQNPKALFRRGLGYAKTQQFDLAKKDFNQLLKLDPNNAQVKKQLISINQSIKQFNKKEKAMFTGMFSKTLYDDKVPQPPKKVQSPKHVESSDEQEIKQ